MDNLMTVDEFNKAVKKWSVSTKRQMRKTVSFGTSSSGSLRKSLADHLNKISGGPAYKVRFSFLRHGVFRAYGAGRGYKRENGVLVKRLKDARRDDGVIRRHPLDWFDSNLRTRMEGLADICQEFYGDEARQRILEDFDKFKIIK